MSDGPIPIIGLAIDRNTRALQAQLRFVKGKWKALLPNLTDNPREQWNFTQEQEVDLQDYLNAAQILFPPKKPKAEE